MAESDHDRQVDYIEFGATDIGRTKQFYTQVFGWRFQDYGPAYTSFQDGRLSGGFTKDAPVQPANPLVVIYAARLEDVESKVKQAGGKIVRGIGLEVCRQLARGGGPSRGEGGRRATPRRRVPRTDPIPSIRQSAPWPNRSCSSPPSASRASPSGRLRRSSCSRCSGWRSKSRRSLRS